MGVVDVVSVHISYSEKIDHFCIIETGFFYFLEIIKLVQRQH